MLTEDLLSETGQARREFGAYFSDLAARRRKRPGDDLLSELTRVRKPTEPELLATCVLLLVAGHETTVNLVANGVLPLLRHGLLPEAARRPRQVVEEVPRYDPPVQPTSRVALEDVSPAGTPVPEGTLVIAVIGAADRHPAIFRSPTASPGRRRRTRRTSCRAGWPPCRYASQAGARRRRSAVWPPPRPRCAPAPSS
nr:cytochrome P450 [Nonomuraea sp. FMUSA5-5]